MWYNAILEKGEQIDYFLDKYFSSWKGEINDEEKTIKITKDSVFKINNIPYITTNCIEIKFKKTNSNPVVFNVANYNFKIGEDITLSLADIGFNCDLNMGDFYHFGGTYIPTMKKEETVETKTWPKDSDWPSSAEDIAIFLQDNFGFDVEDYKMIQTYLPGEDDKGHHYQSGSAMPLFYFTVENPDVSHIVFKDKNGGSVRTIKKIDGKFSLMDSSLHQAGTYNYYFETVVFKKMYEVKDLIKIPSYSKVSIKPGEGTQYTTKADLTADGEAFGGYSRKTLNDFGGKIKIPLYYTRDYEWQGYSLDGLDDVSERKDNYFINNWMVQETSTKQSNYKNKSFWTMFPHLPIHIKKTTESATITIKGSNITISGSTYEDFNQGSDAIVIIKRSPGNLDTSGNNFLTIRDSGNFYTKAGRDGNTIFAVTGTNTFNFKSNCPKPDVRWVKQETNSGTVSSFFNDYGVKIEEDILKSKEKNGTFKITMTANDTSGDFHKMYDATFTSNFNVKHWKFIFDSEEDSAPTLTGTTITTAESVGSTTKDVSLTCFGRVSSKYFKYNGFLHFVSGEEDSSRINTEGEGKYEKDEIIQNYRGPYGNSYYPDNYYYTAIGDINSWVKIGIYADGSDTYDVLIWKNMFSYLENKYSSLS